MYSIGRAIIHFLLIVKTSLFQLELYLYPRKAEASEYAKLAMNTTRTRDKKKMTRESREYLESGPLKYEVRK